MAATDTFSKQYADLLSPGRNAFAITKHDTNELAFVTKAIFVGTTGHLSLLLANDSTPVLFKNIPSGTLLNLRVRKVLDATTAQDIVGIY